MQAIYGFNRDKMVVVTLWLKLSFLYWYFQPCQQKYCHYKYPVKFLQEFSLDEEVWNSNWKARSCDWKFLFIDKYNDNNGLTIDGFWSYFRNLRLFKKTFTNNFVIQIFWRNLVILFAIYITLRIAGYFSLKIRVHWIIKLILPKKYGLPVISYYRHTGIMGSIYCFE